MDTNLLIGDDFEVGAANEEEIINPRNGETIVNMPEACLLYTSPSPRDS